MKRDIEKALWAWKDQSGRLPLLIRGARQVGKTYLVQKFGKEAFSKTVSVNFEFQPQLKRCFDTFDPHEILNKLTLLLNQNIEPAITLLFLDEIQECPAAITALRYFKEKLPALHVVGAGSLLEFALNAENFKMPVGRVQFLHLSPLSFGEFLNALGHDKLRNYLSTVEIKDAIDEEVHNHLLTLVRQYLSVGGMPAIVDEYAKSQNLGTCQSTQTGILQTFRSDFGKYSKRVKLEHIHRVFDGAPRLVGQRFKYVHVDPELKSRELKEALHLLISAGLLHPIYATPASGLPLGARINKNKFKIQFLDVGLAQNACGLQAEIAFQEDLLQINAGSLAEQFVGQEFLAYEDPLRRRELFFWTRESPGSTAEVDFVISVDSKIYPVEVKFGKTGTLKSLRLFLNEKRIPLGLRISKHPLSFHENVLSIPLYMIEQAPRLLRSLI